MSQDNMTHRPLRLLNTKSAARKRDEKNDNPEGVMERKEAKFGVSESAPRKSKADRKAEKKEKLSAKKEAKSGGSGGDNRKRDKDGKFA